MPIASQVRGGSAFAKIFVQDGQATRLIKPSAIKLVTVTFEQSLIINTLGRLSPRDQKILRESLAAVFG